MSNRARALTASWLLTGGLLALAPCAAPGAELPACAAAQPMTPPAFTTRAEAEAWVRPASEGGHSFAGGDVQQYTLGWQQVLVMTLAGSGVATLGIAVYRSEGGHWVRAAGTAGVPFGRAEVSGGAVVVRDRDAPPCALFRLVTNREHGIVEAGVPLLAQSMFSRAEGVQAGDALAANVARLKSAGWTVAEFQADAAHPISEAAHAIWDAGSAGAYQKYIADVPPERAKAEEACRDFCRGFMLDQWDAWNGLFWDCFFPSRQDYEHVARGHFFRAVAPAASRVYDVAIIRRDDGGTLIEDPAHGPGMERMWRMLAPAEPDDFPHLSVYGTVRFVRPTAAQRFGAGQYAVYQVYVRRYNAGGTFLGAEYGETRTRDAYILLLVSRREFVAVQTRLFDDTRAETVMDDLGAILRGW